MFLAGTWIIYEWGSSYAYGGQYSEILNRMFETTMTVAIASNIVLAFFSSMMWIMSLAFSATNPNWVYSCRYMMVYCQMLFTFMLLLITLGLTLAVIQKFAQNPIQIIFTMLLIGGMEIPGFYYIGKLVVEELPLEYYHSPVWWKLSLSPLSLFTKSRRRGIQEGATRRAKKLRERFLSDNEGEEDANTTIRHGNGSVQQVLKMAAESIGRSDLDIATYVTSLEEDLYTDIKHLDDEDVGMLSLYMPRRLAKEVHRIIADADVLETNG